MTVIRDTGVFVGGPVSGRRMSVDPSWQQVRVPLETKRIPSVRTPVQSEPVLTVTYVRFLVHGEHDTLSLWVLEGSRPDEVLRLLVESFPPERAP